MVNSVLTARPARRRARVRLVGLGALVAIALSLGLAAPSSADTGADKRRLDAEISQLRTELEGTSQSLAQAFVELHRTKAGLPAARQALAAADSAQVVADHRNEAVAASLAVAEADATKARDALAQNLVRSQKVQDRLGNLARDEYQRGGLSGLSIALEASSPADFTDRMIMMDTVTRIRHQALREMGTIRAQGQAGEARLVAVRQQVAVLKVQAGVALARAAQARSLAATAKTRLDLMVAAQTRYAAAVAAELATESASIQRMQAQSDSLARVLAARAKAAREAAAREAAAREAAARAASARAANQSRPPNGPPASGRPGSGRPGSGPPNSGGPGSGPPGSASGLLSYPVGFPVSSEFGLRFHPVLRISRLHSGIDFAAPCGSPVYAAADGEVILATPAGQSGGYGTRLVISHGLHGGVDLTTTYNHLASVAVSSGKVARGQVVAYSGNTGLSTGCHLHFETRADGAPVNPRSWF